MILTTIKTFESFLLRKIYDSIDQNNINFLDVGAAGGLEPRWEKIKKNLNVFAFEPDDRSFAALDKSQKNIRYINSGLWSSKKTIKFNLCEDNQVSSVYKPNKKFLDKFPKPDRFRIKKTLNLKANSADNLIIDKIDFIKLDIQGAELEVLNGSKKILKNTLGIEVEVEFVEMYMNQPLFSDVFLFCKKNNFEFVDFTNLCRWHKEKHNGFGQIIFGDCLFLKSPEWVFNNCDKTNLYAYFKILILYSRYDFILRYLDFFPNNSVLKKITSRYPFRILFLMYKISIITSKIFNRILGLFGTSNKIFLHH